ncbi:MAG: DNA topoisomerase IB [Hymenobacteraceae bacterium]|nr:DNA topoisomerase IB [Hymenobacteraceae bacterium]MDX5396948.1 DNA topoisomerase IB [Hymenobacteraceae bacterium]MDX5513022.1 DNA topoisomerase IB [Hymenobacteraceae bacterium]
MKKKQDAHALYADPEKSAAVAGLRYYPDTKQGISRKRAGTGFYYINAKGEKISDQKTLDRIKKLVIPPAWTDVWICPSANGHIQATGRDTKGRKQYLYHPNWQQARSSTKFSRLIEFGKNLPKIREQLKHDLLLKKLSKKKVTAIAVYLLDHSLIRIGNRYYADTNKSYGLTTMRDKHVKIEGAQVRFRFIGKKGVEHEVALHDRRLARLVKKCKDIPGYDLFQYYDEEGQRHVLESGDVNDYLCNLTDFDFTAKDFRTWGGTVRMVECLETVLQQQPDLPKEKCVKEAVKLVAKSLGNTPSVCSKYYIHPQVINLFHEDKFMNYLRRHNATEIDRNEGLSPMEQLVIKMLKAVNSKQ